MNTQPSRAASRGLLALGAFIVAWAGCRDEELSADDRNQPPDTYLVQSPGSGESGFYVNQLYWDGFDPDGRVDFFEVTVTDSFGLSDESVWHQTFRTDSIIRFPVGGESGQDQVLGNRFYVRAVDNLGRRDLDPAWVFFLARDTRFPEVVFLRAEGQSDAYPQFGTIGLTAPRFCDRGLPPDTLPAQSNVTFSWTGIDRDSLLGAQIGTVDAFEYKLSTVNNNFIGGSISDTTATYRNLAAGFYTFTVRAVDDGGLVSDGCRYFQVNFDPKARVRRVFDSCLGDSVRAFSVSTRTWDGRDPCLPLQAWSRPPGLVPPPQNPCLPPGFVSVNDTLRTSTAPSDGWWLTYPVGATDPDGGVDHLEINVMDCNPLTGACTPRAWSACGPLVGDTLVVGPFTSGDHRVVVAAVDALGQRGASSADTMDFKVDLSPRFVTKTDGIDPQPCDLLMGSIGDSLRFCGNDTVYVVSQIQPGGLDAPCAIATRYADGSGPSTPNVFDYNSYPMEGDVIDLVFTTDASGRRVATLCPIIYGLDPDGRGRVGYARWAMNTPATFGAFGIVSLSEAVAAPGDLTPICFCVPIVQDVPVREHTLYVDIRDWRQTDIRDARVAQRTTSRAITFTVRDVTPREVSKRASPLPGKVGS